MFRLLRKFLAVVSAYSKAQERFGKRWYKSKTLWVNIIALLSLVAGDKLGMPLSEEDQLALLAVVNIVLRFVTKEPIKW